MKSSSAENWRALLALRQCRQQTPDFIETARLGQTLHGNGRSVWRGVIAPRLISRQARLDKRRPNKAGDVGAQGDFASFVQLRHRKLTADRIFRSERH